MRYSWSGWSSGADGCDPPEPGKEWITISDGEGDEMAVIVHRPTGHPDSEKWRLQKERAAQRIVDALNAPSGDHFIIYSAGGYEDPLRMVGPFPSYDAAIDRYWQRLIESGYEPDEGENAHQSYLTDDDVNIGHVISER